MFAFPLIDSLPVLSFAAGGIIILPSLGAFLAWSLIAALVGSALGLLREYTAPRSTETEATRSQSTVVRLPLRVHDGFASRDARKAA